MRIIRGSVIDFLRFLLIVVLIIPLFLVIIIVLIIPFLIFLGFSQDILIAGIQVLLTLLIVYYYFSRMPELKILSFNIEPENVKGNVIAEPKFIKKVANEPRPIVEPLFKRSRWLRKIRYVECCERPYKLRIAFDVANVGYTGVTLHEFRFRQLTPNGGKEMVVPIFALEGGKRRYLYKAGDFKGAERVFVRPQERITLEFRFPWDKSPLNSGRYEFLITVYAATFNVSRKLSITISPQLTEISWKDGIYWKEMPLLGRLFS